MTRQEAIELETLCETYIQDALNYRDVEIRGSNVGTLMINFKDLNELTVDKDLSKVVSVKFIGSYDRLIVWCEKIINCINEHKDKFEALVWSHEHDYELEN